MLPPDPPPPPEQAIAEAVAPSAETHLPGGRFARLRRRAADLLFPPGCTLCGSDFGDDPTSCEELLQLCESCRNELLGRPLPRCPKCGVALAAASQHCVSCASHRYRFAEVLVLGQYEETLREAILRTKHVGEQPLACSLARLLALEGAERVAAWRPDAVVPIPMHWRRRWRRGANHAEAIAEQLARSWQLRMAAAALRRRRNTIPQAELAPTRRFENLRGALKVSGSYSFSAARVLLVDDIMTTGATMNEAARVLLRAGCQSVYVAVLGRADAPR